jgi:hypothetical protein
MKSTSGVRQVRLALHEKRKPTRHPDMSDMIAAKGAFTWPS